MSGPYTGGLIRLDGPPILWQSQPFAVPAAGSAAHDFGLHVGMNQGWAAPYLRNTVAANGYSPNDTIQLVPDFNQPGGTPGGGVAQRVNGGRLQTRVLQDIYQEPRGGGGFVSLAASASYQLTYRGIFASGHGPYPLRRHLGPRGPVLMGETPEFSIAAGSGFAEVGNPTSIEPHMWALFGRCVVADGACAVGDVMAFGSLKVGTGAWGVSYSPATCKFVLSQGAAAPQIVGKDGATFTPTVTRWAFFFRFVGAPKGGVYGMTMPMRKSLRVQPPVLWMSPPVPFSAGFKPASFACPDGFSPALVNSIYICKTGEYGYGVGDWLPAQEGNNNANGGGFSAVFRGRNVTLVPQAAAANQYVHKMTDGTFALMTSDFWSWAFVFVG